VGHERAYTSDIPNVRWGRISDIGFTGARVRFWHKAEVWANAAYVGFTPSNGLSGAGIARHAILATDALNVRFLPVPSALPQRADVRALTANGRS
jgi:hypothetical protein